MFHFFKPILDWLNNQNKCSATSLWYFLTFFSFLTCFWLSKWHQPWCDVTVIWGSQSTCRCLFAAENTFALLSFLGDALLGCHRSYRSRPTHGIGKFKYLLPKEVGRRTSFCACFPKVLLRGIWMPHLRRPGWMGFRETWNSGRCACPWQRIGMR